MSLEGMATAQTLFTSEKIDSQAVRKALLGKIRAISIPANPMKPEKGGRLDKTTELFDNMEVTSVFHPFSNADSQQESTVFPEVRQNGLLNH